MPHQPKSLKQLTTLILAPFLIGWLLIGITIIPLPSEAASKQIGVQILSHDIYQQNVDQSPLQLAFASPSSEKTQDIAWGDMDNDGDLDLVVGNYGQLNQLYENDGNGIFSVKSLGDQISKTNAIALGDMDGDGDLDIAVGNELEKNQVYQNVGNGSFTVLDLSSEISWTESVEWGDVNGDGYLDLVVGNYGQANQLLTNQLNGEFESHNILNIQNNTRSVALGDMDGDGDLDLAVGNRQQSNQILENDGSGNFKLIQGDPLGADIASTDGVAWGDMDNDGDFDLAVANYNSANQLYRNTGNGEFELVAGNPLGSSSDHTTSIIWGDIDNDGDLDLISGNNASGFSPTESNVLYLNEGNDIFSAIDFEGIESDSKRATSLALADIDADGFLDLAVGNSGIKSAAADFGENNQIYRNIGTLFLTRNDLNLDSKLTSPNVHALGDVDGDGDLDLAIGYANWGHIYTNIGHGEFVLSADISNFDSDFISTMAWGDSNGDGYLDLAVGYDYRPNEIFINNMGQFDPISLTTEFSSTKRTTSMAWGDMDNDGDLDLIVGNEGSFDSTCSCYPGTANELYRNDGNNNFTLVAFDDSKNRTGGVAWGDLDGDNDLDLIIGHLNEANQIYKNNGDGTFVATYFGNEADETAAVALGDMDGDGDLDLIVANNHAQGKRNRLYENDGSARFIEKEFSFASRVTYDVEWGDLDEDGDLDLVFANGKQNQIYKNDGQGNFIPFDLLFEADSNAVSLGDIDNDGDLDLISGLYLYENSTRSTAKTPYSSPLISLKPFNKNSGNFYSQAQTANSNNISIPFTILQSNSQQVGRVEGQYSLNGGDNWSNAVPSNLDELSALKPNNYPLDALLAHWPLDEGVGITATDRLDKNTQSSIMGDTNFTTTIPANLTGQSSYALDFDGADDFVALGHVKRPAEMTVSAWININKKVEEGMILGWAGNNSGIFPDTAEFVTFNGRLSYCEFDNVSYFCANGPVLDEDHWYHVSVVRNGNGANNVTLYVDGIPFASQTSNLTIETDTLTIGAYQRDGGVDRLFNGSIDDVRIYKRALSESEVKQLANPVPTHVFEWDTFASGFFGSSDNVVFRLIAYPQPLSSTVGITGTYRYTNSVAGPIQRPYVSSTTYPFRVRGTQVRVVNEANTELENALVFRQTKEQATASTILNTLDGKGFRTDSNGYLSGRGRLDTGDQLIALYPISSTLNYTIYQTSASPTPSGLDTFEVESSGVQTLTVSADNHLILFNLVVSLEWDARNDPEYLEQLDAAIQRASQILYDATNGQAALGEVRIYHEKGFWGEADIVIKASNKSRPAAVLGGIVLTPTLESDIIPDASIADEVAGITGTLESVYLPGQISMPPRWSRFGNNQGAIGEDWARVLAHELGHLALFIPDNYLGVDDDLNFKLTTCSNSLMDDPYLDQSSEFRYEDDEWESECGETMQDQYLGRTDWDTIIAHYPMLTAPTGPTAENLGPNNLPLAVTNIQYYSAPTATQTLENPIFPLESEDGSPLVLTSGQVEAFLWKNVDNDDSRDDYLVELGGTIPAGSAIEAWGAEPGDKLCIFDRGQTPNQIGCINSVSAFAQPLRLTEANNWAPEIQINSINSDTIEIVVTNVDADALNFQLITPAGSSSDLISTTASPDGSFTAEITAEGGAYYGHVVVSNPTSGNGNLQTIIPYQNISDWGGKGVSWGGKGVSWGGKGVSWGGKGVSWGGKGVSWGGKGVSWGGKGVSWGAPTVSEDAQVSIYPLKNIFGEGIEYSLSRQSNLPALPGYLTPVGQAYRVDSLNALPEKAAIVFSYLASDVLGGVNNEKFVQIYYLPEDAANSSWQILDTDIDTRRNIASADIVGEGSYLLAMAQPVGNLQADQLNLISWPLRRTLPLTEAFSAIDQQYSSVAHWGQLEADKPNQWLLFDPNVDPAFSEQVNTLQTVSFGSYWIWMNETVDQFYAPVDFDQSRRASQPSSFLPPMVMYGWMTYKQGTQVGDPVVATIGGNECGRGEVVLVEGLLAYVLKIDATSLTNSTSVPCGTYGADVTIAVAGQKYDLTIPWHNQAAQQFNLFDISEGTNLQLTMSVPDAFPSVGETRTLTLHYQNNGHIEAENTQITFTLPAAVQLNGGLPAACYKPGPIICQLGSVASQATGTIKINVKIIETGSVWLESNITSNQPEIWPNNNRSRLSLTIKNPDSSIDSKTIYLPVIVSP